MANSPQAKKRARQSKQRELNNAGRRTAVRTAVKNVLKAIPTDLEVAKAAFLRAARMLDQVASRGLLAKNKAARLKSRLNKRLKLAASK